MASSTADSTGAYSRPSPSSFTRHDSETSVVERPQRFTRRQRCCMYTCGGITSVIFVVMMTIYLVTPLIVRGHANHSTLTFNKIIMTNPRHDRCDMEAHIVMGELSSPVHSILEAMEMTMVYDGMDMAVTNMGAVELAGESEVHITQKSEMRVLCQRHFAKFSRDLLSQKTLTWTLRGDLRARMKLMGVWISTPYAVEFSKVVTVPGFDHLKNISFHSLDMMVEQPSGRAMYVIRVQAYTPSIFDMVPIGNVAFKASFQGQEVGVVSRDNVSMYSGPQGTLLELYGYFPTDPTVVTDMMSAYTNGERASLTAQFSPEDSEIVLYDLSALASHPTTMELIGMQEELIQAALAQPTYEDAHGKFAMPAQFWIWNPFDADLSIPSFNYSVLKADTGEVVSQAARTLTPPMALNPANFTLGTKLDLHPKRAKFAMLEYISGGNVADMGIVINVKLAGNFQLSVGDLTARIRYYSRKPMPLCWCSNPHPCGLAAFCNPDDIQNMTVDEEEDPFFDDDNGFDDW